MENSDLPEADTPTKSESEVLRMLARDVRAVATRAFELMAAWSGESPEGGGMNSPAIPTGFANLDAHIHGLRAGELAVVTGPPGSGKSSLVLNIGAAAAVRGANVLVVSLETDAPTTFIRMCSSDARIPLERILTGSVPEGDWALVSKASERLCRAGMRIIDDVDLTPEALASEIAQAAESGKTPLVVFDGIELAAGFHGATPGPGALREGAIELKRLARSACAAVVVAVDYAPGQRRRIGDGEEALKTLPNGIAGTADTVIHVSRPTEQWGPTEAIIAKARACGQARAKLCFLPECRRFVDWAD